jgi:hypothetical protein
MAHECPECGMTCYCNGDIDDCCFDLPEDIVRCTHYKKCEPEDGEENFDPRTPDKEE